MYSNAITSFTYSDVLKSVVNALSSAKALLNSFAYVLTLVLHQHLPKLNEEKHVNGRRHQTIIKGKFWTKN